MNTTLTVITILNIIAAIPVIAYPAALPAGIMMFDAPGSTKSITAWAFFLFSVGYPLFIALLIVFSRKYESVLLAGLALIPLCVFVYFFVLEDSLRIRKEFETVSRDFICNETTFLHVEPAGDGSAELQALHKHGLLSYEKGTLGDIDGNGIFVFVHSSVSVSKHLDDRVPELLRVCKNREGKSPSEMYPRMMNIKEYFEYSKTNATP
jgi:hypothetical protein